MDDVPPYNSQLDAFELYHEHIARTHPISASSTSPTLPALGHALAGSTASAVSNVLTYPVDLLITRLQVQRNYAQKRPSASSSSSLFSSFDDIIGTAQEIYDNEGGILAFYAGLLQDTTKTVVDSFLFFLMYTFLRERRLRSLTIPGKSPLKSLPPISELSVGFVSGAFSKLITTPISNVVLQKQTCGSKDVPSVKAIIQKIRSHRGMSGFWSGYSFSLVLTLNPTLTFFLFETLKRVVLPKSRRANPPASATFFLAAISKAFASCITYPFCLAKARAQYESAQGEKEEEGEKEKEPSVGSSVEPSVESSYIEIKEKEGQESSTPPTQPSAQTQTPKLTKQQNRDPFSALYTLYLSSDKRLSSLYSGLPLEVLKAFLSHGITMALKQRIHGLIISFWFACSRLTQILRRNRTPPLDRATAAARAAFSPVDQKYETHQSMGYRMRARATELAAKSKDMVNWMEDVVDETAGLVGDYVEDYVDLSNGIVDAMNGDKKEEK
ncbi:MAG: hypothetical protein M1834_000560 [Cirrosporium novae-zelandiae]|nr:MAG: hypothetical protein M1834_000560 [Cirrosporium novae-zelandiae]